MAQISHSFHGSDLGEKQICVVDIMTKSLKRGCSLPGHLPCIARMAMSYEVHCCSELRLPETQEAQATWDHNRELQCLGSLPLLGGMDEPRGHGSHLGRPHRHPVPVEGGPTRTAREKLRLGTYSIQNNCPLPINSTIKQQLRIGKKKVISGFCFLTEHRSIPVPLF